MKIFWNVRILIMNSGNRRQVHKVTVFAGGHGSFCGLINSFVHIIMYTYYLLAALGPSVQKYLWWKTHLTKLQLVRLLYVCRVGYETAYLLLHCVQTYIGCTLLRHKLYIVGKHLQIVHPNVSISNQVLSGGSKVRDRECWRNEHGKWCK